jgi:AraC-like DNA-binding protein
MFVIVSLFGFLVFLVITLNITSSNRENVYLSLFYLSISIFAFTFNFPFIKDFPELLSFLIPGVFPLYWITFPLAYLYVKKSLQPQNLPFFSWKDLLHFIPMLIVFINFYPHLLLPHEEKMRFIQQIILNNRDLIYVKTLFFPSKYTYFARPIFSFIYSVVATNVFLKYYKDQKLKNKIERNRVKINWFSFLVVLACINTIISTFLTFYAWLNVQNINATVSFKYALYFPTFISLIASTVIFFFPSVMYANYFRRIPLKEYRPDWLVKDDQFISSVLNQSSDSDSFNTVISNKLADYFIDKPFLQPGFTLSTISRDTGIPYHHLTIYFNNYLGKNFNDWKNDARIEHAMSLISKGQAQNLTLESIAFSCGFLSRSNFINSFKKKAGLNPSEFLRSIPKESIVVSMDF